MKPAPLTALLLAAGLCHPVAPGLRYYAEGPDGGPEWGILFHIVMLFPK